MTDSAPLRFAIREPYSALERTMALESEPANQPGEEDQRIAKLAEAVAIDPPFVERLISPELHADYLEHAHESVVRSLAVIHMRLAQGDLESATELVAKLRRHLDNLWEQRKEVAVRGVKA